MTETPEELLTHREAAAFLKVHPDTLTRWISEGTVPKPGKVGGRLRYLKSTLVDLARPDPDPEPGRLACGCDLNSAGDAVLCADHEALVSPPLGKV